MKKIEKSGVPYGGSPVVGGGAEEMMSGPGGIKPGMKLMIKPGNEKPIVLTGIDQNDTIGDLKKKIEEAEGIPPGQQQLGFVGNALTLDNDKKRVRDYGIPDESTLDLSVGYH